MDSNEVSEVKGPPQPKRPSARVWNILTVIILVALLCVLSYIALIFLDPNSSLNPFPPPTLNPALYTLTPTVTPKFTLVPSWTPTNLPVTLTETPIPSNTPVPSETPVPANLVVENAITVEPAMAQASKNYAFVLQQGSPSAIAGADFHLTSGCDWSGVAGQAVSMNGEAVRGLFVELGGSIPDGESVDNLVMTGLAPQYGQGGFEVTLANKLVASTGTLWIQLLDQQNLPLSDRIYFDTYDDCQKNLVIIYFSQVH
jgi:hypothetical protein